MGRSVRVGLLLLALSAPTALTGCPAEVDELDQSLTVSGTVSYQGNPVKLGSIHFLPTFAGGLPASGKISDGQIMGVFTREPGDGIKPGKYRIAINAFDEAFLASMTKRNSQGPDPVVVAQAANDFKSKKFIPPRYSNSRESGLVEEISPSHHAIRIELVD